MRKEQMCPCPWANQKLQCHFMMSPLLGRGKRLYFRKFSLLETAPHVSFFYAPFFFTGPELVSQYFLFLDKN